MTAIAVHIYTCEVRKRELRALCGLWLSVSSDVFLVSECFAIDKISRLALATIRDGTAVSEYKAGYTRARSLVEGFTYV